MKHNELNDLLNMTVTELLNEIEKFSNLKDNFSWHDVFELFNYPLHLHLRQDFFKIKKKRDIPKFVNKYIFTQQDIFDFYFKFGFKADFRSGYRLGDGIFYSFEKLPKQIKKSIKAHMPYEREKLQYPTMSKRDWIRIRQRDAYMKISVTAIGNEKAKEKAFAKLRRSYNILNFVVGNRVSTNRSANSSFYYYMHSTKHGYGELSEGNKPERNIWKPKHVDKYIRIINAIFNKKNPVELEQRILNAIDIYGLIEHDTPLHVRFLICIIGLESLLLGSDDRDYLGLKIAEKITFLLADIKWWQKEIYKIPLHKYDTITNEFVQKHLFDSRIKLHEKMKEFYDKRSRFAHTGIAKRKRTITEDDYQWADNFLRWSTERLVPLTKKFNHIAKKNADDLKYLDSYFQRLRYT